MARLRATFWIYVTACVVLVHLVLLPALYFGMGYVIRESHEDLFVEHARTFSRVLADEFEVGAAMDMPGVAGIYTAEHLESLVPPVRATSRMRNYHATPIYPLARGKVRYVGEPVAAVVAESRYLAEDALERNLAAIGRVTREGENVHLDAEALSEALFGDHMPANTVLIGAAYQAGCLPPARRGEFLEVLGSVLWRPRGLGQTARGPAARCGNGARPSRPTAHAGDAMLSRPIILALVVLLACEVSIVPVLFGSVMFIYPTGGVSLYLGVFILAAMALLAALIASRRFFHRP